MKKRVITLIAGPTASGKSDFAIEHARKHDGVIINADSMQVYDILQVITARPSDADMSLAKHYLYGHVDPSIRYSTGKWLKDVSYLLDKLGDVPLIFVGGTGLYFKALLEGLAEIPDVPLVIKEKWQDIAQNTVAEKLYDQLMQVDQKTAEKLNINDRQRILRALEVFEATDKPLSAWQDQKNTPLLQNMNVEKTLLLPERALVYDRIERRFDRMVENGAFDEVRKLDDLQLDPTLPAMKAIGVPEFINVLNGLETMESAIEKAKTQTRRYAKRQMTWFRHQFDSTWKCLS